EKVGEILRPFPVDKLKGVVMPLTNLHMTFRAIPTVEGLFPPPQVRRLEIAMPSSEGDRRAVADEDMETEVVEEAPKEEAKPAKLSRQELSERRLSLIMTYMTDPDSNPALADEALVYRLVAEEREYQLDRKVDLRMRIRFLGTPSADEPPERSVERAQMEAEMKQAEDYEAQLQELLGYVAQGKEE
ncbi:MAG: hypothetical protein JWM80_5594, partial [Cyanobacteria bacterium RYN_339]|nr:hypothetical protein [Cyanobacteria bacterium RYN_339]